MQKDYNIKMGKAVEKIQQLPAWILSAICFVAILWLTLASHPLGSHSPRLFEGADKVVHGIMFGGFTLCLITDASRRNGWHPLRPTTIICFALAASLFGGAIEMLQFIMSVGRSADLMDLLADSTGASIIAITAIFITSRIRHARH